MDMYEEYSGEMSAEEQLRTSILNRLSSTVSHRIKEAVDARVASGIETEWDADEEFYQGFDEKNRHEFANNLYSGSINPEERITKRDSTDGSYVFPNITQPYVDAASARISDMLLPTDDRNFAIEPTPIPDLGISDEQLMKIPDIHQQIELIKKTASEKAKKAEKRIDDWLSECQYYGQLRMAIEDLTRIGSCVVEGPVPVLVEEKKWALKGGLAICEVHKKIKPASKRVDPRRFYFDPSCGEDIHNGSYVAKYDYLSEKSLSKLMDDDSYIQSQIQLCIKEGPSRQNVFEGIGGKSMQAIKSQYKIWYYYGQIKREELIAAGCECEDNKDSYHAVITVVNDRVIKANLYHLEGGKFPFDLMPFKRRPGMPWGISVARQMRTPQRIVVAATRALMDNAGKSSRPHKVISNAIIPGSDPWTWEVDPDADISDVRGAMTFFVQPSMQAELMNIIQFGMKMAEDVTGLPQLMQGQQGSAPETVGGMQILNNNANSVLRRVARLFDTHITEPHMRRYYDWLMEHGEDESEKGDFNIVARGSSALVERDIQSQEMVNVIQLCLNPSFKKNPAKAMDEYLKSRRFDPSAFDYTKEELEKIENQQQPVAPQVQAAQIREQGATERKQMEISASQQENELDRQIEKMKIEIDGQLGAANLSAEERKSLNDAKVTLSGLAMKLNVQKDLSLSGHVADLHKFHNQSQVVAPPTEPVGRAGNGESFEK